MGFINSIKSICRYIYQSPSNKGQKGYRLLLAILWQCYKRTVGLPIISILDNGAKFILEPNSTNSTGNIYVKTYEAEYIYFLRKHVLKNGYVLDIGAHMGLYTLLLNDYFVGGFCFEPAKDTFNALRNNLFINNLIEKYIPVNSAVSDNTASSTLKVEGIFSGVNHVIETPENIGGKTDVVSTVSIDNFLLKNNVTEKIHFLKIDTEGHELKVLKGCLQTLQNNRAVIVLFENSSLIELTQLFSSINFKVFAIDRNGNILSDKKYALNAYNLFAIGSEHPLFEKVTYSL